MIPKTCGECGFNTDDKCGHPQRANLGIMISYIGRPAQCPFQKEETINRDNTIKVMVAVKQLLDELARATSLHPKWPDDIIHAVAIMAEESGEAVKAANNYYHHDGDIEELRNELVHTGAMVIRCLINLDG